jgi:hypothetical protein
LVISSLRTQWRVQKRLVRSYRYNHNWRALPWPNARGTSLIKTKLNWRPFLFSGIDHHREGPGALYAGKGSTFLSLLGRGISCCPPTGIWVEAVILTLRRATTALTLPPELSRSLGTCIPIAFQPRIMRSMPARSILMLCALCPRALPLCALSCAFYPTRSILMPARSIPRDLSPRVNKSYISTARPILDDFFTSTQTTSDFPKSPVISFLAFNLRLPTLLSQAVIHETKSPGGTTISRPITHIYTHWSQNARLRYRGSSIPISGPACLLRPDSSRSRSSSGSSSSPSSVWSRVLRSSVHWSQPCCLWPLLIAANLPCHVWAYSAGTSFIWPADDNSYGSWLSISCPASFERCLH